MIKPALVALLALLCLLLVKANIDIFRTPPPRQESEIAPDKKGDFKKFSPQKPVKLNPTLSPQLPDLNSGYIFNAERSLAKDARLNTSGKGSGQNIRLDDIVFNGAIISKGYKKALVSSSFGSKPDVRTAIRPAPQSPASSRPESFQLAVGDELGGYTVTEITADFILFVKGSDTIKKTLFDREKSRQRVTSRPTIPPSHPKTSPAIAPPSRTTPEPAEKP